MQFSVVSGPVPKIGNPVSLDSEEQGGEEAPQAEQPKAQQQPKPQQQPQQQQQQQQQPQAPAMVKKEPAPSQSPQQRAPLQPQRQPQQPQPQQQQRTSPPKPFSPPQQKFSLPQQRQPQQQQPHQQQQQQQQRAQKPFQTPHHQQQQRSPAASGAVGANSQRPNQAPLISADSPVHVFPIGSLNPYQNRWVIKARVTSKSDIRTWSNARGEGKLFSVDLLDQTGEIRAVGFNEVVDKYYEFLEVGKVYYIARATLKQANGRFSNINNSFEMTFDNNTEIAPCQTETDDVPTVNFAFVQIDQVEGLAPNSMIDLLAIVTEAEDIAIIKTKNGDTPKRAVTVLDATGTSIKLSLWGAQAETFDYANHPVYAFKSLKISDYNGRTLSASTNSTFYANPDIREAHELRTWYESVGAHAAIKTLTVQTQKTSSGPKKTIAQVRDEAMGWQEGEEVLPFYLKAYLQKIPYENKNLAYPACPNETCNNKKVIEEGAGQWHCEKCEKSYPNCIYRYTLSYSIVDFTGQLWTRGFDNVGVTLLGQSADAVLAWKNESDPNFINVFQEANLKQYAFRIKGKMEKFDDTTKPSFQIIAAYPVDPVRDSRQLLDLIAQYA